VKVWIHFFVGDTEGNYKLVGQYPGNREGVRRPYRDCNCGYDDLSNPNPNPKCKYRKLDELREAKRRKYEDEDGGKEYYKSKSMYDIINALLDKNLPLSDKNHGLYKLFPPELLHTSGSGLIMYMFESLRHQIGTKRQSIPPTVHCTYKQWRFYPEEIFEIKRPQMETIH